MLEGHPSIAHAAHDRPRHGSARDSSRRPRARSRLLRALRARRYDLVVHLTEHPRGADARAPAAAALRGHARAHEARRCLEAPLHALLPAAARDAAPRGRGEPRRAAAHRRAARRGRQAARCWSRAPRPRRAPTRCSPRTRCAAGRFMQVHPGSRWLFKCWPAERTAALLAALVGRRPRGADHRRARPARACAGRRDRRGAAGAARARVADATGKLTLRELAARHRARAALRRRRLGADAHRRRDGHAGRRAVRPVRRARVGPVARAAARRRVARCIRAGRAASTAAAAARCPSA